MDDVSNRVKMILSRLSKAERRKGDDDISRLVLDRFCEGWSDTDKRAVAVEVRSKARAIIREQRAAAMSRPITVRK